MLEKVSTYRSELMGFAILWVIIFHSYLNIPILNQLTRIGYGGVDIFLFLSGLGLVFSFNKEKKILTFYRKRFVRILPTYAFIVLITMLSIGNYSSYTYFVNITTIGFWIGKSSFEWYIPSLFVLYFLFPLFFRILYKNELLFLLAIIGITSMFITLRIIYNLDIRLMLFITRIPIFTIGMIFGKWLIDKKKFDKGTKYILIALSLLGIVALIWIRNSIPRNIQFEYGLTLIPFAFITPGLCIAISYILDWLHYKPLNKILFWGGTLSLELYLLHIKLFDKSVELSSEFNIPRPILLLIIVVAIIPLAFGISRLDAYLKSIKIFKQPK